MKAYITERRREERENRRAEILTSARELFASQGVEETSMGQIAERARLSRSLLYVYFRDREDVFLAVVDEGLKKLASRFEEVCAEQPCGLDAVEAIGWAFVDFSRQNPDYSSALARFQTTASRPLGGIAEQVNRILADQIARGVDDGSIHADVVNPMLTGLSLWAFTSGLLQVVATKGPWFAETYGLSGRDLITNGIAMCRRALSSGSPN